MAVEGVQHKDNGIVFRGDGELVFHCEETVFISGLPGVMLHQKDGEGNDLGDQQDTGGSFHDPAEFFPEPEHEEDEYGDDRDPQQGVQHIGQGEGGPVDLAAVQGAVVQHQQVALQIKQEGNRINRGAEGYGQLRGKKPGKQDDAGKGTQRHDAKP